MSAWSTRAAGGGSTYVNDVKSLLDGSLGVEREASIDLGGDLAGNDGENLTAELDQETVEGVVDLRVEVATLALAVGNGVVNQLGILGLLGSSQDERGVGGGILGLVLGDGYEEVSLCGKAFDSRRDRIDGARGKRRTRGY
jgi:hypothetical protein